MGEVVANADLQPAEYFFEGLGRQNMSFEHAIAELIDNAIAASTLPTEIDVSIDDIGDGNTEVRISDQGHGMSLNTLETHALKPGAKPLSAHRLNEHGFGLKNALCSLTKNERRFKILTRDEQAYSSGHFHTVTGPFRVPLAIEREDASEWPSGASPGPGTVVTAVTPMVVSHSWWKFGKHILSLDASFVNLAHAAAS
jgi:hypothetical protein